MAQARNPLDILAALTPEDREVIERETEPVMLRGGEALFHHGDPADALYLVLSGSLGVYVPAERGGFRLIAVIEPGETVGEMAVISGERRSATVKAIRDSELLRLTKARFDLLLKHQPALMAGINRILVHRLRQVSRGTARRLEPKTVAFLPASEQVDPAHVAEPLAKQLQRWRYRTKMIGPAQSRRDARWFTEMERQHDHLFLCGALDDESWIRLCARQADRIVLVASAGREAPLRLPQGLLQQRAEHQLVDILLLHEGAPRRTARPPGWIAKVPYNRLFHLRLEEARDWRRIARVLVGQGLGLVLSGGGARAFSQIGVMRALAEADLEVDFVGGASMGAILAAGIAMDWSLEELTARVEQSFVRSNPLNDYTLPIVGLVKGRKVERRLRGHFGDVRIEDLWLPTFFVSSNLTSGEVEVHRTGDVVEALRASIALPGILPPCVAGDSLLVDGAVMNNLPVDIMREIHRGPIVAIDVTVDRAVTPAILEAPSGLAWLARFLNPPLITLLMRAGTVTSEAQRRELAREADLLIEPPLGDIDIRDWRAFDRAVAAGYEHAKAVLAESADRLRHRHIRAVT